MFFLIFFKRFLSADFSSGLPDFWEPFCALLWRWALKNVGTCFCQRQRSKSLVSATFFTERERPTGTVMHKKRRINSVSMAYQRHIYGISIAYHQQDSESIIRCLTSPGAAFPPESPFRISEQPDCRLPGLQLQWKLPDPHLFPIPAQ